jgi:predicted transcriptional regulator
VAEAFPRILPAIYYRDQTLSRERCVLPTKREQFVQTIRAQWLGQRMRELRDERGLTLKYVAAYLGVELDRKSVV